MCFALAVCFAIVKFAERAVFGIIGVNMITKIRKELMEAILHKQINWFDREDRAPGVITGIMSADITALNGLTSETLVILFEVIFTFVFGVVVSAIICKE